MGSSPITGHAKFTRGPITYEVFAAVAIGQIVCPGTSGNANKVGPAGANAINALGVATKAALPAGTANTGTSIGGFPLLDATLQSEFVAVGRHEVYAVLATGTVAFGDYVKCGASGSVVKWVDGTDTPGMRIGQCVDAAGATNGTSCLVDFGTR